MAGIAIKPYAAIKHPQIKDYVARLRIQVKNKEISPDLVETVDSLIMRHYRNGYCRIIR